MTPPKNLTELLQLLESHAGEFRRRFSYWNKNHLLNQRPLTTRVGKALQSRVLAIREDLKVVTRMARKLSKKLESIAAAGPDPGVEPPAGAVMDNSTQEPT